jgi:hypothetical protein
MDQPYAGGAKPPKIGGPGPRPCTVELANDTNTSLSSMTSSISVAADILRGRGALVEQKRHWEAESAVEFIASGFSSKAPGIRCLNARIRLLVLGRGSICTSQTLL